MKKRILILFVCLITFLLNADAQLCDSNYFSMVYSAKAYSTYTKAVTTPQNEVITAGNLFYPRGWMTKITSQGNVIWSNQYSADYEGNNEHTFNTPDIIDLAPSSSSSYVIAGSIIRDWDNILNGEKVPPPVTVGLISNIDQSGNVLWSREIISKYSINKIGPAIYCTHVFTLKNGDIIAYLAMDKFGGTNKPSYGKIVCFTPDGTLKWQNNLNTGDYEASDLTRYMQRAFTQTKNGNIIVADGVCNRDFFYPDSVVYKSYAMHLLSLNPTDGSLIWERSYEYPPTVQSALTGFKNITELPDGNLSFITELGTSADGKPPYQYSPVNMITNAQGKLIKTITYNIPDDVCILNDVKNDDASGTRTLLFTSNSNNSAILTHIDAAGNIIWSKGYANASKHYPPICLSISRLGYDIFFSDNSFGSYDTQVIITDPAGNAECANSEAQVIAGEGKWQYIPDSIHTIGNDDYDGFVINPFAVAAKNFSLDKTVTCQKFTPCCVDVIDTSTVKNVSLCEGDSYTLPDNRIVTATGRYDVSFTTFYGCDSTYFINVQSYKKPSDLMPVADTCLDNRDSVVINITSGFSEYNWGTTITQQPSFSFHQPGTYYVKVANYCGTKTDTIQVYPQCDYPIYMPTAFTPNNDQLNDLYRVPPQNKNRLLSFKIYNRFGQLVFVTTDKKRGWDGNIKSFPADTGTYTYYLEMSGITGKRISQKGTFVLIR